MIIVTHNAALAPIADRVIQMHDAKVKSIDLNDQPQDIASLEY
ncbi:peptide ABC transporter ATPase [Streptococcus sobrinus DSM 20742 = ATCC 33478]|nr:peptide ABC transporter ATPase [Streptococcus sobrinus DSM 20742 = ATCC 33478]